MTKSYLTFILFFLALNIAFSQEKKETKDFFKKYRELENKEDFLQAITRIKPNNIKRYDYGDGYFLKAFKIETEQVNHTMELNQGVIETQTFTKAYYYLLLGKETDTTYTKTRLFKTPSFLNPTLIVEIDRESKNHKLKFYGFKKEKGKITYNAMIPRAFWSIIKEPYSAN